MKINIRVIAALVIAAIVAYLAFDGVRQQTLEGSQLNFSVHTGRVELVNNTGEPMQVRMTSGRTFTVARSDGEEAMTSTRQGTGRNLVHVIESELPPGNLELRVTRGSDVNFTVDAPGSVQATVFPRSEGDAQSLIIVAVVVVVALLAYAAYSTRESWLPRLRRGTPPPTQFSERVIE